MKEKLKHLVESYIQTALWCEELQHKDIIIEPSERLRIENDILKFYKLMVDKFGTEKANEIISIGGQDVNCICGHDLYLTRNGHGAGFWDKHTEYFGLGDELTELAEQLGDDEYFLILANFED